MKEIIGGGDEMMTKTLSNMVFDFFEFEDQTMSSKTVEWVEDDDEDSDMAEDLEERKLFWELQHQLLQEVLSRDSGIETRIRIDVEDAIREPGSVGPSCTCLRECRHSCELRNVSDQLRNIGYNSALCKAKWQRSPEIPLGEHNYIDVMVETKNRKKAPIRVVIELNFRAEFEMARASPEYNSLAGRLPEVFVGKAEKLKNVIRIMCDSAKKCMKDNRRHLAPWRKHKYMQAKWLGTYERVVPGPTIQPAPVIDEEQRVAARPRASMLTFDLHCMAVKV